MPSFNPIQKAQLLVGSVVVTALVVLMVVLYSSNKIVTEPEKTSMPLLQRAELTIAPQFNVASTEDEADFEVRIDSKNEFIKGIALRVVFPYQDTSPLVSEGKVFDLMDVPVDQGWIVAVNSVEDTGSALIADFSAINTSPEGYKLSADSVFTMIRFATSDNTVEEAGIEVDVVPSKLALSDGRIMEFVIETKPYTVK